MRKFHRNSSVGDCFVPSKRSANQQDIPDYSDNYKLFRPGNQAVQRTINDTFNEINRRRPQDLKYYEIERVLDLASLGFDDDHIAEVIRVPVEEVAAIIAADEERENRYREAIKKYAATL
ncbi:hypothetical protein NRE35_004248 [Salmonella enterica]|nr:hypothetical protein [Salmonella enterica]